MAGLCLRRFVRLLRCSDGAGLAGFVASAVTERSAAKAIHNAYFTNSISLP